MDKLDINLVSEQYRDSIAHRIKEIDKDAGDARQETLERLKNMPVFKIMESVKRGGAVSDLDDAGSLHYLTDANDKRRDYLGQKTLESFWEGGENWENYKLTNVQAEARSKASESAEDSDRILQDNQSRFKDEIEIPTKKHEEAVRELRKLEVSEEATITRILLGIGYHSQGDAVWEKFVKLRTNSDVLTEGLRQRVEEALNSKEEPNLFMRIFVGKPLHSKAELRLVSELDNTISVYLSAHKQLSESVTQTGFKVEEIKSKYTLLREGVFAKNYSADLLENIVESLPENSLSRALSCVTEIEKLEKQNDLARHIREGIVAISGPIESLQRLNDALKNNADVIAIDSVDIKSKSIEIEKIDEKIALVKVRPIRTADDVSKKLAEIKSLEDEKEKILGSIKKVESKLDYSFDVRVAQVHHEAIIKAISPERINKISEDYNRVAEEIFGISGERELSALIEAHEKIIGELNQEIVRSINGVISENIVDRNSAALNLNKLSEYIKMGGKAVKITTRAFATGYCTEGHRVDVDRYDSARLARELVGDRKYLVNLAPQIMLNFNDLDNNFDPSYNSLWFPVNDTTDISSLKRALSVYTDVNRYSRSKKSSCDVYTGYLETGAEVL